jgi:hypothetical protein
MPREHNPDKRRSETMKKLAASMFLLGAAVSPASAQVVYTNDFNTGSTANLTANGGGVGIRSPFAGCSSATYCTPFLSRANGDPFDNHVATLFLTNLPSHLNATVRFSLFILQSWDGNRAPNVSPPVGPDRYLVRADGATLLNTTFSGDAAPQCYPSNCPASHTGQTGATEINTLGTVFLPPFLYGDAVYELAFTFAHASPTLTVDFEANTLQGWPDEGWAIDDITVSVSPEPASLALIGTGLVCALGASVLRRRKRTGCVSLFPPAVTR